MLQITLIMRGFAVDNLISSPRRRIGGRPQIGDQLDPARGVAGMSLLVSRNMIGARFRRSITVEWKAGLDPLPWTRSG